MLKPLKGHAILLENMSRENGGVTVDSGVWSPFLDYTVLRAPDGETEFGPGDRVVLRFSESGRKVSWRGIACRVVKREDIVAVEETDNG